MTAKAALRAVLDDSNLCEEEKLAKALSTARKHRMSVVSLKNFANIPAQIEMPEADSPLSVETCIEMIVQLNEKGRLQPEPKESAITASSSLPTETNKETSGPETESNAPETNSPSTELEPVTLSTADPAQQSIPASSFNQMTEEIRQLRALLIEFSVESADRERRYTANISALKSKVVSLEDKIDNLEKKVSRKLDDQSTRTGNLLKTIQPKITQDWPLLQEQNPPNPRQRVAQQHVWNQQGSALRDPSQPPTRKQTTITKETGQEESSRENQTTKEARQISGQTNNRETIKDTEQTNRPIINSSPIWKTVNRSASNKRPSNILRGGTQIKRKVFFVGGIDPDCSLESIINWCNEKSVKVSSCRFIPSKIFGTKSARLSVSAEDASSEEICNQDFWPDQITARPWHFPASQTTGEPLEIN